MKPKAKKVATELEGYVVMGPRGRLISFAQRDKELVNLVSGAGMNKISLLDNKDFTGTYWISANDLYFAIVGRHLNEDFESGRIPKNTMMEALIQGNSKES